MGERTCSVGISPSFGEKELIFLLSVSLTFIFFLIFRSLF